MKELKEYLKESLEVNESFKKANNFKKYLKGFDANEYNNGKDYTKTEYMTRLDYIFEFWEGYDDELYDVIFNVILTKIPFKELKESIFDIGKIYGLDEADGWELYGISNASQMTPKIAKEFFEDMLQDATWPAGYSIEDFFKDYIYTTCSEHIISELTKMLMYCGDFEDDAF